MNRRSAFVRMLAFLVVGLLAAGLVVVQTVGSDALRGSYRVRVHLPDSGGIVPNSQVTYRGTAVGTVAAVTIDPGGKGITVAMDIETRYRVPKDTRAAVSMDVPIAIEHVDLRPRHNTGPYLEDGDTLPSEHVRLPVPFHRFLRHGTDLLSSIDTKDLATVGDQAQTALSGMRPELRRLLANSERLMGTTEDITPRLLELTDRGTNTLQANKKLVDKLPKLAKRVRSMTEDINGLAPKGGRILDNGNSMLRGMVPKLNRNQRSIAVIIANLASSTQVLSRHIPALVGSLTDAPEGLRKFAGVFFPSPSDPGVTDARVDLTGAPGPVCYYGTKRRTPQETGHRRVQRHWNCPADKQYLQQRGSANAPDRGNQAGTYDPKTDIATRPDGSRVNIGGQSSLTPQSWSAPLFRGVQ